MKQASTKIVSSATNGICTAGGAMAAAASIACCARSEALRAKARAWRASSAAWPASLSSMGISFLSARRRQQGRVHDRAALRHQRALDHLVGGVELHAIGVLVDQRRDEVQEVAREHRA